MDSRRRSSRLKSPTRNRRQTLGPVPTANLKNRNETIDGGSHVPNKKRPPRASMLPRVGRENNNLPSVVTSTTASSRRKSIGGAAFDNQNRRKSVGKAPQDNNKSRRPSVGGAAAPEQSNSRRKSVGPAHHDSHGRRQSYAPAPQPTSSVVARDPRNMSDKAYQQQCMKQVLSYLLERGYENHVSMKTLRMPSGKDFASIMTFLMRRVDGNFQREGDIKFEDEVSLSLKNMGYPFPISKTALVSAGSPHTWPQLLAVLSWLVKCLEGAESVKINPDDTTMNEEETSTYESIQQLEEETDKRFFVYLAEAYQAFMGSENDEMVRLETELAGCHERDDAFLEQEIERITDLNATIVERINDGDDQSQEIKAYSNKREDYATDLEQFQDLIRQMNDHKAAMEKKVKERKGDLKRVTAKTERTNQSMVDLQKQIETQDLSIEDAQKLDIEKRSMEESIDRVLERRRKLKESIVSYDAEIVSLRETVDSFVEQYNTKITDMSTVPLIGPIYARFTAEMSKDDFVSDQTSILGVDLKNDVQIAISKHLPEIARRTEEKHMEFEDGLDEIENQENANEEASVKLNILVEEYGTSEETIRQEQSAQEAKLTVRQREVTAMHEKSDALRDPVALEEQIAGIERQCTEIEALRRSHNDESIAQKRSVAASIASACRAMKDYEKQVQEKLLESKRFWTEKKLSQHVISSPRLASPK